MKMILDLDHVISEMGISPENYAKWKTANLDSVSASGSVAWSVLEECGFTSPSIQQSADRRIG